MGSKNIYLDNHSSTQLDKRVFNQMKPFFTNFFGNPHSESHSYGWRSNKFIDISRDKIAKSINANKEEIFFTSGATESNNLILKGVLQKGDHFITSSYEHPSILNLSKIIESKGIEVTYVKPDKFK